MTKKCIGCGAILQSIDKDKVGYIPEDTKNENRYCMRCFKIMHYNENIKEELSYSDDDILAKVNQKAKYVFFLIDYLNINKETITTFKKVSVPKTLVISKCDIIPKSQKEEKIINWLHDIYNFNEDIIFTSSLGNTNISKIINISKNNNIKEAYIMGYTNAGKSSLINAIASKYKIANKNITTSINPNTTLDFIKFKVDETLTFIDTPGFNSENIFSINNYDLLKKVNPKKVIRPITIQCHADLSFNIEDKININVLSKDNSITFYMSNNVELIKKHGNIINKNMPMEKLNVSDNDEIVIKGLGFINIKKACEVLIFTENKNIIEIRKSSF